MKRSVVVIAGIVVVVAAVGVASHWLTAMDLVGEELEDVLSATLGSPVSIGELEFTLVPDARLTARRITFSDQTRPYSRVGAVHVDVSLGQVWRGDLVISELRLDDFRGTVSGLMAFAGKLAESDKQASTLDVRLRHIVASPVHLATDRGRELGPYEVVADLGPGGGLESMSITRLDQPARLQLTLGGPGDVRFVLAARDWRPHVGPPFEFDYIEATGVWREGKTVQVERVHAKGYGGTLDGGVHVAWGDRWRVKGKAKLVHVRARPVLSVLGKPLFTGTLDWDGSFDLRASKASRLLKAPRVEGEFTLGRGVLYPHPVARRRRAARKAIGFERLHGRMSVKGRRVEFQRLTVAAKSYFPRAVGPYNLQLDLARNGRLVAAALQRPDGRLQFAAKPTRQGTRVKLKARDWVPPVGPRLKLDRMKMTGRLYDGSLQVAALKADLYGGTVLGSGSVAWGKSWNVELDSRVKAVELEPLLAVFGKRLLAGRFYATGTTRLTAASAGALFERPAVKCDFLIRKGAVHKVDLEKAATNFSGDQVAGGRTEFDELSGHLAMRGGRAKVSGLRLTSSGFEAKGHVAVNAQDELDGEVDMGLSQVSAIVGVPMRVTGTTQEPSLRPTTEAIAGAAAGTALLGPGVGTAVGLKAGQALKRLGVLFNQMVDNPGK